MLDKVSIQEKIEPYFLLLRFIVVIMCPMESYGDIDLS